MINFYLKIKTYRKNSITKNLKDSQFSDLPDPRSGSGSGHFLLGSGSGRIVNVKKDPDPVSAG